jgi:hypothetical protein
MRLGLRDAGRHEHSDDETRVHPYRRCAHVRFSLRSALASAHLFSEIARWADPTMWIRM